jgi:hypothetical protein
LLFIGQGSLYFRYRYPLITEYNINFGIEPIRVAADEDLRLWFGGIETKIL